MALQYKNKWLYTITFSILLLAVVGIVIVVLLLQKENAPEKIEYEAKTKQGLLMDTFVTQTTYDTADDAQEKMEQMFDYLAAFEKKVSMYDSDSEISKLNRNAGVLNTKLSDEVYQLLARSKELCLKSNGRFDITIGPLVRLWGITSDHPAVPADPEIQKIKKRVNIKSLTLNEKNKTAKLTNPYMEIDLGGVAKGYACDLARKKYQELGLSSCLLSLGGNIYSYGTKPDGTAYTIGIRDPRGSENDILGTLAAPDRVISTTGDYERYFEQDGTRYHHVLDPKTGYPAKTDLISVTVIASDGILADYLSTNFFIAGKAEVLKNLGQKDYDIIAVDKEKNVYLSEGIKRTFRLTEGSAYRIAE